MKKGKNKINVSVIKKINDLGYILIDKRDIERIKDKYIMIGMKMYFDRYMKEE